MSVTRISMITLGLTILYVSYAYVNFSMSGPAVEFKLLLPFWQDMLVSLLKLTFAVWVSLFLMVYASVLSYQNYRHLGWLSPRPSVYFFLLVGFNLAFLILLFVTQLFFNPSVIVVNFSYDQKWLAYFSPLLNKDVILALWCLLLTLLLLPVFIHLLRAFFVPRVTSHWRILWPWFALVLLPVFLLHIPLQGAATTSVKPARSDLPNIIMLGADTLRADRLSTYGYQLRGQISPNIDALASKGLQANHMFVPLARTAPSLSSIMTGRYPWQHRVRTNFVTEQQVDVAGALPQVLAEQGYVTSVVGDWAATDLGKFEFGFSRQSLPADQWNLTTLIAQGPKNIRLLLSLFWHHELGRRWLPEIFYVAGSSIDQHIYQLALDELNQLAGQPAPFFMTVFSAGAHIPFASRWPYYQRYSNPDYEGESKYVMSSFGSIREVMKNMARDKRSFDIEQINALYDGTVSQFDDLVGEVIQRLVALGIAENTLVVVFSDHGVDLFEQESWGQGNLLYPSSYRIPFILYDPRDPKPHTINHTTSSLSIAPTILQQLGIRIPSTMAIAPLSQANEQSVAFYESGMWLGEMPGLPKDRFRYPNITELLYIPDPTQGTLAIKESYLNQINRSRLKAVRQGPYQVEQLRLTTGTQLSCSQDPHPAGPCDLTMAPWQGLAALLQAWILQEEQQ
ncbi:sulfatase family protein [Motilimonas eburnea]|uniref:sulfatase family protein n=1 Tax=Motilimonas eburnea TaxID=1737488 RepID=UPI001E6048D7|nr:sulfatase-like hydrolase/transferase [Motilimonas eburnea]MCE2572197.1 sulfatase-like hydrolase/transferase [Motilimonas eburnea]